jgi:hypothetical protein
VEVVNGGFPDIEGKNILDYKDPDGKYLTRDIINTAATKGSGWVDYLWPKPGETKPSRKHTYVRKAVYGGNTYAVGSGAYIRDESAADEDTGNILGQFVMLELTDGILTGGRMTRETAGSVFLASSDGSAEVWFPRSKIANIRKPTDSELEKLRRGPEKKRQKPAEAEKIHVL